MIKSFGDKESEKIWNGTRSRKLPNEIQDAARRKMRMLNSAQDVNDLRIPPANRLEKLKNIHPGEILLEEFLIPLKITAYRLAKETFLPQTRISEIIKGKRRITADTALRFSKYFGTSAKFWLGLQDDYDLEEERNQKMREFESIIPLEESAV